MNKKKAAIDILEIFFEEASNIMIIACGILLALMLIIQSGLLQAIIKYK